MRFPEFTGEWEKFGFADHLERLENGANYDTNATEGLPMSRIETISSYNINYDKVGHCNSRNIEHYKMKYGDILFSHINSMSHIGKTAYYYAEQPLYHGMNLLLIRCKDNLNSLFFYYLLNTPLFLRYCQIYAKQAVNQASISTSDIKRIKLSLPTLHEQNKIASFISVIDQRIATQNKIIEDLKTLKSAISAKLLHNSCWNDMKIHEICHTLNYKQYIAKNIQETGEFPVIQQGDNPICGYSHETPFDNYKNVLLFGDHTLSLYKPNSKFLLATDGIKVLLPTGHIKRDFLYYLLEANMPKSEGYKRHYSILKEVNVKVPPIEEQEKISGVFIAIDDKIALEQLLKSSYKAQKAFLLQQMFI